MARKWNSHGTALRILSSVSSSGGGLFGRPETPIESRALLYWINLLERPAKLFLLGRSLSAD
jgi:hypothetical protein